MSLHRWSFDPIHSSIEFSVRHLMIAKVRGRFATWDGTFSFDPDAPASSQLSVRIDAASIDTREAKRDEHLRSADFFDVANHPHLTFVSQAIEPAGDAYRVTGDLTIHGVTRPVTLVVEYAGTAKDPWGGERAGFTAHASISRKDFGLHWNVALEAGGFVVGDKIDLELEIEAIKAAAEAAAPLASVA